MSRSPDLSPEPRATDAFLQQRSEHSRLGSDGGRGPGHDGQHSFDPDCERAETGTGQGSTPSPLAGKLFPVAAGLCVAALIGTLVIVISVALTGAGKSVVSYSCSGTTTFTETIPTNMSLAPIPSIQQTHQAWLDLINAAKHEIRIASFYITLTGGVADAEGGRGQAVFDAILAAAARGVSVRIAMNIVRDPAYDVDPVLLAKHPNIELRSLNFSAVPELKAGVLHTKFFIVDNANLHIGSANLDWRSLSQVKELGAVVHGCTQLAHDLGKVFEVYWAIGKTSTLPARYPNALTTQINEQHQVLFEDEPTAPSTHMYIAGSPSILNPGGRTSDLDALTGLIDRAQSDIMLEVMTFIPTQQFPQSHEFWPTLYNRFTNAAAFRHVSVRLLLSQWGHSSCLQFEMAEMLNALKNIEVRVMRIPELPTPIPYTRVNHAKFVVSDAGLWLGTSNLVEGYFRTTAGVSLNLSPSELTKQVTTLFERDWASEYAHPLSGWRNGTHCH